ncbi:MAG: hypothetical protein JWM91_3915 [Rhodospirillales bacterium]|nr:hypothetical protein [Rhodospirillales bacterium]
MNITIQWPRFLIAAFVVSILVFVLTLAWHGHIAVGMYADYPGRPADEVKALLPFLFATIFVELAVFAYLYLRVYPQRSLSTALWWGAWGGFFIVLPNGQFFVGTPNVGWDFLAMQMLEGIAMMMIAMAVFQLIYRPKDENWLPAKTDQTRFLIMGILSAILVFALDLPFHQLVAQKIFTEYPAHDFPHREHVGLVLFGWLFVTYLFQLSIFCYLFLRVYPQRGMANAIWFGVWLGVWVVIPNMQMFVAMDKYTWKMLFIQVPEGAMLTVIMMIFFEWAYRPKARIATLAAAE